MKCVVVLKAVEEVTLQQMSINHRHRDTRTRAAGLLMLGRGLKARAIAAQLGVSGQSVYNWSHAWRERGICGLMGAHNGGRHALLTEAQIAVALEIARAEALTLGGIAPARRSRAQRAAALQDRNAGRSSQAQRLFVQA